LSKNDLSMIRVLTICTFLWLIIMPMLAAGQLTLMLTSNGTTCQHNNGSITATVSGGVAPFSYSENGYVPQNNGYFLNLAAGSYSITVTDATGAMATQSVTLTNTFTAPTVSAVVVPPTGCATTDASITLTGSGGLPPYQYSLDELDYQTSNYFPNLTSGYYYCSVKDANGCATLDDIQNGVTQIPQVCPIIQQGLGLSWECDPFRCEFILLSVTGGTPPYLYSTDGINYQTSNDFEGLPAGLQTEWVKDATGKIMMYTAALVNRCTPVFSISAVAASANCGLNNGSITVFPGNGVGPYSYSLGGGPSQSGNVFSGLAPGGYTVTGTDGQGLQSTVTVTVTASCLLAEATAVNSTCGNNNGSILATASGGVPPYQYALNGGNFQATGSFTGLAAGVYTVNVKDAAGGGSDAVVTVGNTAGPVITGLTATATSCTVSDGTVAMTTLGGAAPFQYSLDQIHFQAAPDFAGVSAGSYQALVQDVNGCTATGTVTVAVNNTLTVDAGHGQTICQGSSVGLNAQSDAGSFSWQPTAGLSNPGVADPIAAPMGTTTYYLTVTSGSCNAVDSVTITVLPAPVADAGGNVTICFGKDAQLNGSGGLVFSWSPATFLSDPAIADPVIQHPTSSITYRLQVQDANHCTSLQDSSVTVTVTPPAGLFAGNDTSISIGEPLPLYALDVNNSGFTQYNWVPAEGLNDPSIQDPVAVLSSSMVYIVTASTPAGCEGSDTISIKVFARADIYVPNAFTPNGDGHNDILRAIPVGIRTFRYFMVYNRWGQEVFRTSNPAVGWNGGSTGGTAVFVWMAAGIDYQGHLIERKGTVILVR